jgi:hypothetical protein
MAVNREQRIDIVRGIAILTILLNHFAMTYRAIGYRGWEIPTPTQFGYSSAASIFVALSGYMVGMVYMRRERPVRAVLKRALDLYLVNFAIFLIVAPFALLANPARDRFWYMQRLVDHPLDGTIRFLTLRDAPAFLDVLQLYIAFLLMAPLAIWLVRRSRWLLVAVSLGLWAVIQLWPFVMPRGLPVPIVGRSLNALAWQMAFFLPMIAGMDRLHVPIFAFLKRRPLVVLGLVVLLVGAAILHEIDPPLVSDWKTHLAITDRNIHAPVWTLHALILLFAYLGLLALATPWLAARPFQLLASLGRNSLNVYAASIPIIFALAYLTAWVRIDRTGLLIGTALVVLACLGVAAWSDARKQRRKAAAAQAPAAQPA